MTEEDLSKRTLVLKLALMMMLLLIIFATTISSKIYLKNKYSMEPLHIYLLNYMAGYTLRLAFGVMVNVDQLAQLHQDDYCPY